MVIVLQIIEAILSIALIAAVVLQSGKGGGLSGSIGGGAESVLGGKKKGLDEYLSKVTMILGALFAIVTLSLVKLMS
ncbi:preprotein translocase subunit SecG [Pelosinus sp. sgz500959]|uniref:preprotein translocase subunit SecG n=1 Tax=Pelosinus sp. sgz500959 TaxID=3242472 RepID=UPI00366F57FF